MANKSNGYSSDIINVFRGLAMGCADIVPGVSGGTVALILGHYRRLVAAISNIDSQFLGLVKQRKIREALEHIEFRFLAAVAIGMAAGIVALASIMNFLLENHLGYTYAVFSGLIIASSTIVFRRLNDWRWSILPFIVAGAIFAWQVSVQQPAHVTLSPLSAFLCATVAICAMILPGISGAFVLLLLGVYHPVTELIKGLPKGDISASGLLVIAAFVAGCLVGLLSFSRILRWLLQKHHDRTLGFLMGLMIGSLYKIWPFQTATTETLDLEFKEREFLHVAPGATSENVVVVGVIVIAAIAATFLLEWIGSKLGSDES
ncbi:MAG: DUF368 domain-containing protein [Aureliella sp.]